MGDEDRDPEEQPPYWQETQRLYALQQFVQTPATMPLMADGRVNVQLAVDHAVATEAVLEAIRRIAERSFSGGERT